MTKSRMTAISMSLLLTAAIAAAVLFVPARALRASFEYTPIDIEIPFSVSGTDVDGGIYKIVIEPKDSSCPKPKETEKTVTGSGSGSFEITADEPGTYEYKIYERKGDDADIIYDDTSYTVTVFVTSDDEGNLGRQIVLSDGTTVKPKDVKFTNRAVDKPTEPTDPTEPTEPTEPTDPTEPTKPDEPTVTPTKKPDNPVAWTGETVSRYLPYGLICLGIGIGIIVIVIIRRKRDSAS